MIKLDDLHSDDFFIYLSEKLSFDMNNYFFIISPFNDSMIITLEYHFKKIQDYLSECITIYKFFLMFLIILVSMFKINFNKLYDNTNQEMENKYSIERLLARLKKNNNNINNKKRKSNY